MVPETLVIFSQLTRLIAGEDVINISLRESFGSEIIAVYSENNTKYVNTLF
jgi:hypothetical protein